MQTQTSLKAALDLAEKGLPIRPTPHLARAVHWTPAEDYPVHRWFKYREGYSPELLAEFPIHSIRLDPFCGCGTTLLASAQEGVPSLGVDVNPLATFVSRVKTSKYTVEHAAQVRGHARRALSIWRRIEPAQKPPYPLIDKHFLPQSLQVLLGLKAYVDAIRCPKLNSLLTLAWLSILEASSNVFKEGNGLKYRNKRRRPGEYETLPDEEWIPAYFGPCVAEAVERLWIQKCSQIADDIEVVRLPRGSRPRIRTGSCLDARTLDFGTSIDLVVFSPPYANRFDYFESFKVELWMGGFVDSPEALRELRSASMRNNLATGRRAPSSKWEPISPFLEEMDEQASSVAMGIKPVLEGYFADLRLLLCNLKPQLRSRGTVAMVVGNSAYARSIIPTDALAARVAEEEGYDVMAIMVARHLHVSSQQRPHLEGLTEYMRESVVVLERR